MEKVERANAKQTVAVTLRRWPKKHKNCLHWTRLRRVTNAVLGVFNQLPLTASPLSHCGRDEGKKTLFLVLELNRGQKSYDDVTYWEQCPSALVKMARKRATASTMTSLGMEFVFGVSRGVREEKGLPLYDPACPTVHRIWTNGRWADFQEIDKLEFCWENFYIVFQLNLTQEIEVFDML